jgi:excisionase family DNA binding protein
MTTPLLLTPAPRTTEDTTVDNPLLLTVEQAAKRLGIGRTLTYTLINRGDIPSVCIGRLRRIPADALTAYTQRLAADQHSQPEV